MRYRSKQPRDAYASLFYCAMVSPSIEVLNRSKITCCYINVLHPNTKVSRRPFVFHYNSQSAFYGVGYLNKDICTTFDYSSIIKYKASFPYNLYDFKLSFLGDVTLINDQP